MPHPHRREMYLGKSLLVPRLRMLGYDAHRSATQLALHPHEHEAAYEFCLTRRGAIEWWVGDEVHETGPGDVYVTRPGERHGGVDAVIQPSEFYWVQVAATPVDELTRGLAAMRLRVFPASSRLIGATEALLAEHARRDALSRRAARAELDALLVALLRDHDAALQRGRDGRASAPIAAAAAWALARLGEEFTTAEWARQAGLRPTQFHARFRAEMGLTPADWRTRQRVRLAKQLLRNPSLGVTDVAMRSGFATSQYFATVFKRLTGVAPRDYRARSAPAIPPPPSRSARGSRGRR